MQINRSDISTIVLVLLFTLLPFVAAAQTASATPSGGFASNGIFGCNPAGADAMSTSVGAKAATGGVYVPVSDAAVTLNTGTLVYLECILRPIVDAESNSETTGLIHQQVNIFLTGNNGNPMFPQQLAADRLQVMEQAVSSALSNGTLSQLNPALQATVQRAVLRTEYNQLYQPQNALACSYQGDLQALTQEQSNDSVWTALNTLQDPACNPLFAYQMSLDLVNSEVNSNVADWQARLNWGQGTYDRINGYDAEGNPIVVTPASLSRSLVTQALEAGFAKTQNANDIGQMVGTLFAGIGNQVVTRTQGLAGLLQPIGSQPSYLDQVAKESSQNLISSATNAAISILNNAMQVEAGYHQAMQSIANSLLQTASQLRGEENQCWALIIQNVCTGSVATSSNPETCTDSSGAHYTIATSTAYSQAIIESQIMPLASSTAVNLDASNKAEAAIQNLIAGVTNTSSLDAQRVALQQLDALVASNALHSQSDLANATNQASTVQSQMQQLVTDTASTWGDNTDFPSNGSSGWCNVNNPPVVTYWANKWKQ